MSWKAEQLRKNLLSNCFDTMFAGIPLSVRLQRRTPDGNKPILVSFFASFYQAPRRSEIDRGTFAFKNGRLDLSFLSPIKIVVYFSGGHFFQG